MFLFLNDLGAPSRSQHSNNCPGRVEDNLKIDKLQVCICCKETPPPGDGLVAYRIFQSKKQSASRARDRTRSRFASKRAL